MKELQQIGWHWHDGGVDIQKLGVMLAAFRVDKIRCVDGREEILRQGAEPGPGRTGIVGGDLDLAMLGIYAKAVGARTGKQRRESLPLAQGIEDQMVGVALYFLHIVPFQPRHIGMHLAGRK